MTTSIQLVFYCSDPDRMADFWSHALGYRYRLQPPPEGFDSWDAFLESIGIPVAQRTRLKALGATDERGAIERSGGEYWVRMNDPEGNEFCVQ